MTPSTVKNWMVRHAVPLRSRSEVLKRRWATAAQQPGAFGRNRQMVTGGVNGAKRRNNIEV